jgi:nucleoside-diphosphate-sugar epimerase
VRRGGEDFLMRLLVTGHLGYFGSVLTPLLVEAGHTVFGIDSELFKRCNFYLPTVDVPSLKNDIRDIQPEDIYGFDAIIHLASLSNDPLGDLNPRTTYEINYTAAVRLASLAKYAEIPRFIMSSSVAVYGTSIKRFVNESSPAQPQTTFALAKRRAEIDISKLADDYFTPVFLRKPTLFGMSPFHRTDSVVNNLVAWATDKGICYLKTDGTSWRPVMHVEDAARAFVAAVSAPTHIVHNQTYNLCRTEDNYTVLSLAEHVQNVIPEAHIDFAQGAQRDPRSYRVEGSKLANLPGWKPRWTLEDGIRQLYAAYRERGIKIEEYEGARFKRVAYVKQLIAGERLDASLRWSPKRPAAVEN